MAEHLPPIELVADVVELEQLARGHVLDQYLLPCRGGGVAIDGAGTTYLDERPEHRDWTLIGCERSQQIHEHFYGERAAAGRHLPAQADRRDRRHPDQVLPARASTSRSTTTGSIVPWGASLDQISEALTALVAQWEPSWAPA